MHSFFRCPWWIPALLLVFGCKANSFDRTGDQQERGLDPWLNAANESIDPDSRADDTATQSEPEDPLQEVCDGKDNDGDGETDEGLDGDPCEASDGGQGTLACISGKPRCQVCEPGTTREETCGCDLMRTDICGEDGVWRQGACDPCDQPEPIPCGFCGQVDPATGACEGAGECNPGDVMYRRCDECPESASCGSATCVGEKWECEANCIWKQVEGCEIRPSECERDAKLVQACGQCGIQVLECDGCFWNRTNCREQGTCFPGARIEVPCFKKHCTEGFANNLSCNADCEWVEAQDCFGCEPGVHTEMVDCVYRHPRCGKRELQYECVITQEATECQPAVGTKMNFVYLTDCPPIECYPGQQESQGCSLESGEGGLQTRTCNNECEWPENFTPCTTNSSSCVPGTVVVEETDCGCQKFYTTTKTCQADGMGWDVLVTGREDCPECMEGDDYSQSCTASDGRCGTQTTSCDENCEWSTGDCVPKANSCVAGETSTRSCNHTCGAGQGTYTCIGCNWYLTGECVPNEAIDCLPGETRTVNCNPEGCPQQQDVCSDSCHWIEGNCPACG